MVTVLPINKHLSQIAIICWANAVIIGYNNLYLKLFWKGIPLAFTGTNWYCISNDLSACSKELNI